MREHAGRPETLTNKIARTLVLPFIQNRRHNGRARGGERDRLSISPSEPAKELLEYQWMNEWHLVCLREGTVEEKAMNVLTRFDNAVWGD